MIRTSRHPGHVFALTDFASATAALGQMLPATNNAAKATAQAVRGAAIQTLTLLPTSANSNGSNPNGSEVAMFAGSRRFYQGRGAAAQSPVGDPNPLRARMGRRAAIARLSRYWLLFLVSAMAINAAPVRAAIMHSTIAAGSGLAAQTWDINRDWSDVNNPSGPWSLRFGDGSLLSSTSLGGGWSTPQPSWGSIPGCWFKSNGTETVGHDWIGGDIVTHTADSGDPSLAMVIRWTSPIDGLINVTGDAWWGGVADQFFRANDWAVELNNVSLTGGVGTLGSGSGRGSGNPINFSTEGTGGPNALTNLSVHVGDKVELIVSRNVGSFGGNGAYSGVNFTVTSVPEPSMACLLVLVALKALRRVGRE